MSEFKTDKIKPVDAGSTTTLGESGDTIATSSGTTLDIQGTYSGINAISWDTTAKTADFTAETNRGYFVDTSSASVTVTLPASPVAGSFIGIKDYALTADTNAITIARNGNNIQGTASDVLIQTEGGVANLVYVDATQGWLTFDAAQASDVNEIGFVTATGGTVTTCGDDKIHTFTGPGTFCVSNAGTSLGSNTIQYLIVAGGGGADTPGTGTGGGGAGGYRTASCYSCISVQSYPITVGAGGANGADGGSSSFNSITSAGGGASTGGSTGSANDGGSGAGSPSNGSPPGTFTPGSSGNTPPVSPPQGNDGGRGIGRSGTNAFNGGGGGGASQAGFDANYPGNPTAGKGGDGSPNTISGSDVTYAGGGGGAIYNSPTKSNLGGAGGGGDGAYVIAPTSSNAAQATDGTANTGGGGGGGNTGGQMPAPTRGAGVGGSGIVIIRYKYQ